MPNMPVCLKNGSYVKVLSHWPNTLVNTVVIVGLFQLGNNQVIYKHLKLESAYHTHCR
jgi:hypothetical protein